jgi:hypothetical protein
MWLHPRHRMPKQPAVSGNTGNGQRGITALVKGDSEFLGGATEQVGPFVVGVRRHGGDLGDQVVVLGGEAIPLRGALVGQGTLGQGFGRGDQVEYGINTIVGRLDGLDGLAHFILPNGQVAGTLGVTLGREKRDGIVQCGVDFFAA